MLIRPPGHFFCNRIQVTHLTIYVCGDHTIPDGLKCHSPEFFFLEQGLLSFSRFCCISCNTFKSVMITLRVFPVVGIEGYPNFVPFTVT